MVVLFKGALGGGAGIGGLLLVVLGIVLVIGAIYLVYALLVTGTLSLSMIKLIFEEASIDSRAFGVPRIPRLLTQGLLAADLLLIWFKFLMLTIEDDTYFGGFLFTIITIGMIYGFIIFIFKFPDLLIKIGPRKSKVLLWSMVVALLAMLIALCWTVL